MLLLIDNYDSFVYNLARYAVELGYETQVVRNDAITVGEIRALRPDSVILSPGPCDPSRAGVCLSVVEELGAEIPILGVCLGHQVVGQAYGAKIVQGEPIHGRVGEFPAIPFPTLRRGEHDVTEPADLGDAIKQCDADARTENGLDPIGR